MAKPAFSKQPQKPLRKLVTLKTRVGEARDVVLTGTFTDWAKDRVRLAKGADGEWSAKVELAPGEYQYRLLVDGEWRDDPTAQARVPNEFGTTNCVLRVD